MSIHIEEYDSHIKEKWDDFVESSWNGTIFHTRKFLSYHPPDRFIDKSLIIKNGNRWIGVFPAALDNNSIKSHPGSSYGGIIMDSPLSIRKTHRIVEKLIEYLNNQNISKIELTSTPSVYRKRPCDYIDFVLIRRGFSYQKRELTACIPTSRDPFNYYKQEARTATRKAKRAGITVKENKNYEEFYRILEKNLKMRHDVTPTHTLKELEKLIDLFPDKIRLFSSFYKKEQVAGSVLFQANSKVVLAFYISHVEEYQHLRPVNILFYKILKWCYKKHFKFLDLGTFTLNMEPNFGLGRFKESLGAQGVFRDYLEYKF